MRNGFVVVFRRHFQSGRVLQGFRRLIKPPIDIFKLKADKDESPTYVSTEWQQESDKKLQKWVRRADGTILKLQSITRTDIELLEDADIQEPSVYVELIQECGNSRALEDGKRVHAHLAKAGLHKDPYVANFLLNMYGKCGSMDDARQVLENMEFPNVISWNIMITAYARNGHLEDAKSTFDRMPSRTTVSWNSMLNAYAQERNIENSRAIFEKMPQWTEVSWTTVMTAYAQDGDLLEAMSFFNRMPSPDVVAWTSMIQAHALKGLHKEAMILFRTMNQAGFRPDKVTLLTVLESCDSRVDGIAIHAAIIELGLQSDVVVGSALIKMYGRCGCLETARKIFVKIHEKDVVAWTSMVNAYADNGHLEIARHMLERMPIKNSASWNVVITAYARNGHMKEARSMFESLADRDVITWTTMITGYAQRGQGKKSLELFRMMVVDGISLDRITLVSVLYICATEAALKIGEAVHEYIIDSKMTIDANLGTALMNMYGKCGNVEKARELFDLNHQKDIVSWNAMIQLYGQNGHGKEAIKLHTTMVHEGVKCDDVTSINVLSACSHAGLQREARKYFLNLEDDYGVSYTIEHYVCIMDMLARAGRVYDARDLIDNMPFEPHGVVWTVFTSACKAQGKTLETSQLEVAASG